MSRKFYLFAGLLLGHGSFTSLAQAAEKTFDLTCSRDLCPVDGPLETMRLFRTSDSWEVSVSNQYIGEEEGDETILASGMVCRQAKENPKVLNCHRDAVADEEIFTRASTEIVTRQYLPLRTDLGELGDHLQADTRLEVTITSPKTRDDSNDPFAGQSLDLSYDPQWCKTTPSSVEAMEATLLKTFYVEIDRKFARKNAALIKKLNSTLYMHPLSQVSEGNSVPIDIAGIVKMREAYQVDAYIFCKTTAVCQASVERLIDEQHWLSFDNYVKFFDSGVLRPEKYVVKFAERVSEFTGDVIPASTHVMRRISLQTMNNPQLNKSIKDYLDGMGAPFIKSIVDTAGDHLAYFSMVSDVPVLRVKSTCAADPGL